jgi:hypothetical protein
VLSPEVVNRGITFSQPPMNGIARSSTYTNAGGLCSTTSSTWIPCCFSQFAIAVRPSMVRHRGERLRERISEAARWLPRCRGWAGQE